MAEPLYNDCDCQFMIKAIRLAKLGEGKTSPNPIVGAVIVKNNTIIGKGWHRAYGALHAERDALQDCVRRNEDPTGSTLYVTLEPCCHYGKQPPCTQAIVEARIAKVVVGSRDPNPLVSGKGLAFLRDYGIEVIENCMREQCDMLNDIFFHVITTKQPYVALKYAMTADGKIATKTGASKWITGIEARMHVQRLRNKYACICVGIGTVLADDPLLTCRIGGKRNPVRIICDSTLRIPLTSTIVGTADAIPTIIAACSGYTDNRFMQQKQALERKGIEVLLLQKERGSAEPHVDFRELVALLGERGFDSILIEGGAEIHAAALCAGVVNKLYCYIAPKIFGSSVAKSPIGGKGITDPHETCAMRLAAMERFQDDILLEYEVVSCLPA
ncbi:MAG: bifunctional diaminohydroxyphosphoribosylaminopyrimidine deaminase/5-amino-6-(5-phosphoribosylamino)uracil reductase RibD [Treponema sp.]